MCGCEVGRFARVQMVKMLGIGTTTVVRRERVKILGDKAVSRY